MSRLAYFYTAVFCNAGKEKSMSTIRFLWVLNIGGDPVSRANWTVRNNSTISLYLFLI